MRHCNPSGVLTFKVSRAKCLSLGVPLSSLPFSSKGLRSSCTQRLLRNLTHRIASKGLIISNSSFSPLSYSFLSQWHTSSYCRTYMQTVESTIRQIKSRLIQRTFNIFRRGSIMMGLPPCLRPQHDQSETASRMARTISPPRSSFTPRSGIPQNVKKSGT